MVRGSSRMGARRTSGVALSRRSSTFASGNGGGGVGGGAASEKATTGAATESPVPTTSTTPQPPVIDEAVLKQQRRLHAAALHQDLEDTMCWRSLTRVIRTVVPPPPAVLLAKEAVGGHRNVVATPGIIPVTREANAAAAGQMRPKNAEQFILNLVLGRTAATSAPVGLTACSLAGSPMTPAMAKAVGETAAAAVIEAAFHHHPAPHDGRPLMPSSSSIHTTTVSDVFASRLTPFEALATLPMWSKWFPDGRRRRVALKSLWVAARDDVDDDELISDDAARGGGGVPLQTLHTLVCAADTPQRSLELRFWFASGIVTTLDAYQRKSRSSSSPTAEPPSSSASGSKLSASAASSSALLQRVPHATIVAMLRGTGLREEHLEALVLLSHATAASKLIGHGRAAAAAGIPSGTTGGGVVSVDPSSSPRFQPQPLLSLGTPLPGRYGGGFVSPSSSSSSAVMQVHEWVSHCTLEQCYSLWGLELWRQLVTADTDPLVAGRLATWV